jgi:hypothetical protein
MVDPQNWRSGPVLRLRLRWRKGGLEIVQRIPIRSKTLPPHQALPDLPKGVEPEGFWFEAVDAQGAAVYRRLMHNLLPWSVEIFDEEGGVTRQDSVPEEVWFDVLIPDLPEITELRLYANPGPFETGRRARGGRPLAAFPVRETGAGKMEAGHGRE